MKVKDLIAYKKKYIAITFTILKRNVFSYLEGRSLNVSQTSPIQVKDKNIYIKKKKKKKKRSAERTRDKQIKKK